ncbi:MAG TPA: class I SAM-dependent methyltransferase [Candidatus Synoicihabitans sp.]|nr:class I SAM-dependent methyltransferase [Candidatus Synoicihabitans sp.]
MQPNPADPKAGERAYYQRIGEAGRAHAKEKPFSDSRCSHYLADAGALLMLMQPAPRRVLELGCGSGWLSLFLARAGYHVTGIDIAEDAITIAREAAQTCPAAMVEFHVGDYETALRDQRAGCYDYVVFYDSLHHAEDEARAVATAYAALRQGGALLAFEPGEGHGRTADSRRVIAEFGVHEKDMPPAHIIACGRRAGFRRHLVLPSPHDFLRTAYRRDFDQQRSQWRLWLERLWGYLRLTQRLTSQRRGGLTVMWK